MYRTEREILGELHSISRCLQLVLTKEQQAKDLFSGAEKIWFVGSGSSYCLAKSAAAMFTMRCNIPSFAVAAGDFLLHSERYSNAFNNSIVVFISRSGMTSEVLEDLKIVAKLQGVRTVSICASAESCLNDKCDFSICVPWAFDESVCQTRTIGSFYSCFAMLCAIVSENEELKDQLAAVCKAENSLNEQVLPMAREIAGWDWNHVVVLSDAESSGLMEEGALAFKEICCLNSNSYNLLDVRHGPMVLIDENTFVFASLETGCKTELELVRDLKKKTDKIVSFGPFSESAEGVLHFNVETVTDPIATALIALYILQNTSLYKALQRGVNPDQPSGLSAWIAL